MIFLHGQQKRYVYEWCSLLKIHKLLLYPLVSSAETATVGCLTLMCFESIGILVWDHGRNSFNLWYAVGPNDWVFQ